MIRFLTLLALSATFLAAFALYSYKYDTRRLELRVNGLEALIERTEADIAVFRAERGHLARPDRIGRLAREHLALEPLRGDQFGRLGSIPTREQASAAMLAATPAATADGRAGQGRVP